LKLISLRVWDGSAEKKGVRCRFTVADLLGDLHEVKETFDFGYDWEFLHHIFPEEYEYCLGTILVGLDKIHKDDYV